MMSDDQSAPQEQQQHADVRFPRRALWTGAALTIVLVVAVGWAINRQYEDLQALVRTELHLRSLAATIVHLDEVLTMSARMSAATGDLQWEQRYRHFEPALDGAIKETMKLAPEAYIASAATATDAANVKLVALENDAFAAVRAGDRARAASVLFSLEYELQKQIYAAGMSSTIRSIEARAEHMLTKQRERLRRLALMVLLLLGGVGAVWARVIQLLRRYLEAVAAARRALNEANEQLERRVVERTRALADANDRLTTEMRERERMEVELRQAQKLESVGQLAAGIAHEINTPIQFVSDSVEFLAGAYQDLHRLIESHQRLYRAAAQGQVDAALLAAVERA